MTINFLARVEGLQPFTEEEAWFLFKLAAISEAIGWTLLITGLLFKYYITPGNSDAVIIAGQIHGTIFLIYIAAVLVLYSSLKWSRKRTIIAGLASVPPYGSLIFEQWAAYKRRNEALKRYREIIVYGIVIHQDSVLAVQPREAAFWYMPGGTVLPDETAEAALQRIVAEQLQTKPQMGRLMYIFESRHKSTQRLEMFFEITNVAAFKLSRMQSTVKSSKLIDDVDFISVADNDLVRPAFLSQESVVADAQKPHGATRLITE